MKRKKGRFYDGMHLLLESCIPEPTDTLTGPVILFMPVKFAFPNIPGSIFVISLPVELYQLASYSVSFMYKDISSTDIATDPVFLTYTHAGLVPSLQSMLSIINPF